MMTGETKIFVLEDQEIMELPDGQGMGFFDCEIPCIQAGCRDGMALVYWFRTPPFVKTEGKIEWSEEISRAEVLAPPRVFRVTSDEIEELSVERCPSLQQFDIIVLDCVIADMSGIDDLCAGVNFYRENIKKILRQDHDCRIVLLTQRKDTVEFPYDPQAVIAWKDDIGPLRDLIASVVSKSILKAKCGKIAVYDNAGLLKLNSLPEEMRQMVEVLPTPISSEKELLFHRGYLEISRMLSKKRAKTLLKVSEKCCVPIAFTWTSAIESGVQTFGTPFFDPVHWFEHKGLLIIEPTAESVEEWVERFSKSPVVVGGEEMARVVRSIISETRYLVTRATADNRPDPNKAFAVLIHGESRTGKSSIVRLINALSAETDFRKEIVRYAAPVSSEGLDSALFGTSETAYGAAKGGTTGLLGFSSPEGVVLSLDEAENLAQYEAIQIKFLDTIDSGEYRRWGEAETRYINKAKFVLITMEDPNKFHPALRNRTKQIRMPSLDERKDDIEPLANYLLIEMERFGTQLSSEAIKFLQRQNWKNKNVAGLKAVLELATKIGNSGEIDVEQIKTAWNEYCERGSAGSQTVEYDETAVLNEERFPKSGNLLEATTEILTTYRSLLSDSELNKAANVVDEVIRKHRTRKDLAKALAAKTSESMGVWQGRISRFASTVEKKLKRKLEGARAGSSEQ